MRTTLTLDEDVAAALRKLQRETKESWRETVNGALRAGIQSLAAGKRRRPAGKTRSVRLGRPLLGDISNVQEVLSLAEGDPRR